MLAALSLLYLLVSAGSFSTLGVVLPAMVRELGWSWTQAGLGYTLLGVSCGLTSIAAAAMVRRIGCKGTLLAGGAMLAGGFALLAATRSVDLYLAATVLIGAAFSFCTSVPGTYILTGLFARRSTVLGAYFTVGALGGVAGPILYLAIAHLAGWRAFWWVFAGAAVALTAFAAQVTPNRVEPAAELLDPHEQAGPKRLMEGLHDWTVRRALRAWPFYVIVGAYTMYLLINTTAHGFAVEHLLERGISQKSAAALLSLEALIGAVVSVVGGVLGERVRAKTLMLVCLATLVVGMVALAYARGYGLMGVYAVGVGIGYGLSFVASSMLLLTYFGRRPYLELYSIMCLISTAAALGPALGGWARDALGGFGGVFLACALAAAIMLAATLVLPRPTTGAATPTLDR
ncbi:MAG: MFS transporter [Caulobacteraceae bacterium]|nr:MFS transporter [Caulobacteraceae bacterium]